MRIWRPTISRKLPIGSTRCSVVTIWLRQSKNRRQRLRTNPLKFGVKESLVVTPSRIDDAERARVAGVTTPFWEIAFDFVLAGN